MDIQKEKFPDPTQEEIAKCLGVDQKEGEILTIELIAEVTSNKGDEENE